MVADRLAQRHEVSHDGRGAEGPVGKQDVVSMKEVTAEDETAWGIGENLSPIEV
jgi:hypothetical protein